MRFRTQVLPFILLIGGCTSGVQENQLTSKSDVNKDEEMLAPQAPVNGSTATNRTTFKDYADASTFLQGLMDAQADEYGNIVINHDGSAGNRCAFRLSDVVLLRTEENNEDEYYGGKIGPRVVIEVVCKKGPCITDPGFPDGPKVERTSFFVTDITRGLRVFETLNMMQQMLGK